MSRQTMYEVQPRQQHERYEIAKHEIFEVLQRNKMSGVLAVTLLSSIVFLLLQDSFIRRIEIDSKETIKKAMEE